MNWLRKVMCLAGVSGLLACGCDAPATGPLANDRPALTEHSPGNTTSDDRNLEREYHERRSAEQQAMQLLQASGFQCRVEPLSSGELAQWAEQRGEDPLNVVVAVSDTRFSACDDDLAPLAALSEVNYLCLNGTKVTDRGLGHVAGLRKLRTLLLGDTQVTDAGLAHIEGLPELQTLWLRGTSVSDEGMAHLAALSSLQSLLLDRTSLTDAGLARLSSLKSLNSLGLSGTQVTDAGLVHLKALDGLRFVNLYDTGVTDAGVATLRRWLPEAKINLEPPPRRH